MMTTNEDDYWDDSEFEFFNTFDDDDKLLYIYDLLVGDTPYAYDDEFEEDGDVPEFEFEFDDSESEFRQEVSVMFDDDGGLTLTGARIEVLEKVATDLIMNGMILSNREDMIADSGLSLITYIIVGASNPISINWCYLDIIN